MKHVILLGIIIISSLNNEPQEEKMFCFASVKDLNELYILSEIYEITNLKTEADLNSFKVINTNSFLKLILSMGHTLPTNINSNGLTNRIVVSKDWEEINKLYSNTKKNSNGKFIIIDKETYSVTYPSNRGVLIRD